MRGRIGDEPAPPASSSSAARARSPARRTLVACAGSEKDDAPVGTSGGGDATDADDGVDSAMVDSARLPCEPNEATTGSDIWSDSERDVFMDIFWGFAMSEKKTRNSNENKKQMTLELDVQTTIVILVI